MINDLTRVEIVEAALFFIFTNAAAELVKYGAVKLYAWVDAQNKTFLDVE